MRVVVDANIVAAAIVRPGGWTATQFDRDDMDLVAPMALVDELAEHRDDYAEKARCSRRELERRLRRLLARCELIPTPTLRRHLRHPLARKVARVDPDNAVYVAAFVAARADLIWTRDHALLEALPGIAVLVPPQA